MRAEGVEGWGSRLERGGTDTTTSGFVKKEGVMESTNPYRGTLLMRNSSRLGTYSRTMFRAVWWS